MHMARIILLLDTTTILATASSCPPPEKNNDVFKKQGDIERLADNFRIGFVYEGTYHGHNGVVPPRPPPSLPRRLVCVVKGLQCSAVQPLHMLFTCFVLHDRSNRLDRLESWNISAICLILGYTTCAYCLAGHPRLKRMVSY